VWFRRSQVLAPLTGDSQREVCEVVRELIDGFGHEQEFADATYGSLFSIREGQTLYGPRRTGRARFRSFMPYAADERAARSAAHLPKALGALLRRWAGARRRAWEISESWTVVEIATQLAERRRSGEWPALKFVLREIDVADIAVRNYCQVYEWIKDEKPSPHRYIGGERAMTIGEIHDAMKPDIPSLTREKLRKVLHGANRKQTMRRVKRGLYIKEPYARSRWEEMREWDEADAAWFARPETLN